MAARRRTAGDTRIGIRHAGLTPVAGSGRSVPFSCRGAPGTEHLGRRAQVDFTSTGVRREAAIAAYGSYPNPRPHRGAEERTVGRGRGFHDILGATNHGWGRATQHTRVGGAGAEIADFVRVDPVRVFEVVAVEEEELMLRSEQKAHAALLFGVCDHPFQHRPGIIR